MILTNSSAAKIGSSAVTSMISATAAFRYFMCYAGNTSESPAITGSVGVIKDGSGPLRLSGVCTYTGQTKINQGVLELTFDSVLNGVISGAGSLTKTGITNITIGGNNTYSGGTLFNGSGSITFSSGNAFGTGLFTAIGSAQIIIANSATVPNNFQINSGSTMQYRVNTASNILTLTGNISGSNGNLNKTSTGQLRLNGSLTYTGSTTITAGTLRAIRTVAASTATASFTNTTLSVSFNVSPPSGTTNFRFFQGTTTQSYASVTLTGVPVGTTATYNSSTSTLSVTVP